jgi:signal transduction histidine kinase
MNLIGSFARLSIRAKFTLASTTISIMAIFCATAGYLYYQATASRQALADELETLARVVGTNAGAAILFNDAKAATEVLGALKNKPEIVSGEIFLTGGTSFAIYRRGGRIPPSSPPLLRSSTGFTANRVDLVAPIAASGERVGWIRLIASLEALRAQQAAFVRIALLIVFAAGAIAFALSTVLQKAILRPIVHLADTMTDVSRRKDFSARADRTTDDELGTLIGGFNEMLAQIETQHTELELYRRSLEDRVEQRTAELSQANQRLNHTVEELREANTRIEAANRAKSEFLANMSHELRTPLNAIIGFSEIIRDELFGPAGTPSYVEYAGDIWTSGSHLLNIINDILDMTKVEMGTFRLNEQEAGVADILASVHKLIAVEAERRRILFPPTRAEPPEIRIRCDPTRLRQILLNLLSNAVKFTNPDGTIELTARQCDDGIEFRVRDDGVGIDPADFEHILAPFGQVQSTYARNHQGVGLGLSLTKVLVEQHGGRLALDSAVGRGTTVTVTLPPTRIVASADMRHPTARAC